MNDVHQSYEQGAAFMTDGKYEEAANIFEKIIDLINPSNDDDFSFKFRVMNDLTKCYIELKQFPNVLKTFERFLGIYQQVRPESFFSGQSAETIKADKFSPLIGSIYTKCGEAYEQQFKFLDALKSYSHGALYSIEAQCRLDILFQLLEVPQLQADDEDIQPFYQVQLSFIDDNSIYQKIEDCHKYLELIGNQIHEKAAPILARIDETHALNIIFAAIQIYMENPQLILIGIKTILAAVALDLIDSWRFYVILRTVLLKCGDNIEIVEYGLKYLCMCPIQLYPSLNSADIAPVIAKCLCSSIQSSIFDQTALLLFNLADRPIIIESIISSQVLNACLSHRTLPSLYLISRLVKSSTLAPEAEELGVIEWCCNALKSENDTPIKNEKSEIEPKSIFEKAWQKFVERTNKNRTEEVEVVMSILPRLFMNLSGSAEDKKLKADNLVDSALPAILKFKNSTEIVTYGFAALTLTPEFSKEKLRSAKAVVAASLLLSMHMGEPQAVQNIVAFLFECAFAGMNSEIKVNKAIIPTVMKALERYQNNQSIVERATGLAILCDIPNKFNLVQAAVLKFPESEFFRTKLGNLIDLSQHK